MEVIKKLKGEIKRMRQELILQGSRKKEEEFLTGDSDLDEEE